MYPQSMFGAKMRKISRILLKIFVFYKFKNVCILQGQVFVMDLIALLECYQIGFCVGANFNIHIWA